MVRLEVVNYYAVVLIFEKIIRSSVIILLIIDHIIQLLGTQRLPYEYNLKAAHSSS